jgi:hypothetical protein
MGVFVPVNANGQVWSVTWTANETDLKQQILPRCRHDAIYRRQSRPVAAGRPGVARNSLP